MPRLTGEDRSTSCSPSTKSTPRLAAAVQPEMFALYAAPGDQPVREDHRPHRGQVEPARIPRRPDRSRYLDFEPHRVLDVYAHYSGRAATRCRSARSIRRRRTAAAHDRGLFYTVRRLPRRRTGEEKRYGAASDYTGTDMFISLVEPAGIDDDGSGRRAERARALLQPASDRTSAGRRGRRRFPPARRRRARRRLRRGPDAAARAGRRRSCAAAARPPHRRRDLAARSTCSASIISAWSSAAPARTAQSLREILSLFADLADSATERKIRGVRSVDSRPVVRRVQQRTGIGAARGIEITVTLDEKAFEGSGVFLLGAVLDRFFCRICRAQSLHADGDPHRRARRDHALAGRASGSRRPL